jgi:hypothetical protein
MPRFSDDGRWAWDYGSGRWIPANKIGDTEGLKKLGIENIIVEPGNTSDSELRGGDGNGTNLKLLAMAMALFLPGIDYSVLGWIKPRKTKQIWLGIGIFFTFSILLGTAILCPLAFLIWLHGIATVAARADDRVVELGGYTNDISGNRVVR